MLSGMDGRKGNDIICKYGFAVNGYSCIECSFVYGNIKILCSIFLFCLYCEMQVREYGVKICKDGLYAFVVRIKDEEDIFDIKEIVDDHMLVC
jgi:hypothetical protein